MRHLACVFFWLVVPETVLAQAGVAKPLEVVAHFTDGSVIRRVRLADNLEVQTRYGKLSVPIQDVRRIEFATRIPEEIAKQIDRAIEQLGSKNFMARESASKELAGIGARAHAAVKKAAASSDMEVARRAKEILTQIEDTIPAEQLRQRPHDVIRTTDSVLTGQILSATLRAKTGTFGETQLAVAELQTVHLETQVRAVALDGAKFPFDKRNWVDSGIVVDAGCDLKIHATGEMDLCTKNAPGQQRCGPDGSPNFGQYADGTLPGMLMGRIGESGTPFVLGSHGQLKAAGATGKLYLSVISAGGEQMSGNYQVRVTTGPGIAVNQPPPATSVPLNRVSYAAPAIYEPRPAIGVGVGFLR